MKPNDMIMTPNGPAMLLGYGDGQRCVMHKVSAWPNNKPLPEHYKGGPGFVMWYEAGEVRELQRATT